MPVSKEDNNTFRKMFDVSVFRFYHPMHGFNVDSFCEFLKKKYPKFDGKRSQITNFVEYEFGIVGAAFVEQIIKS